MPSDRPPRTRGHVVAGARVCSEKPLSPEDREWVAIEIGRMRQFMGLVSHRYGVDVLNTLPEWRSFLGLPYGLQLGHPVEGGRAPEIARPPASGSATRSTSRQGGAPPQHESKED